jgi:hypothetical protein
LLKIFTLSKLLFKSNKNIEKKSSPFNIRSANKRP